MIPSAMRSRLARETAGVGVLSGLLTIPVLGWLSAPLSVPYDYAGDASFYLMMIRNLGEHGRYLTNTQLGFPHGGQLYDLPQGGDNLNLLLLRLLSFAGGPGTTINLFHILGFVAAAAAAHYVLRRLGAQMVFAALGALLFTFLPYHLLRGEAHLLLSMYWVIPLAMLFVLSAMGDDAPFTTGVRQWRPGLRLDAQACWTVAGCIAIGSSGPYYAIFFAYLAVVAGLLATLARRHMRHLWSALLMSAVTGVTLLLNLLPTLLYWARNGQNPRVFARQVQETETYGLRIQQLFLPRADHRVGTLARLGYRAYAGPVFSEAGSYLGVVVSGGLIVVVIAALANATGGSPLRGRMATIANSGLVAVVAALTGTISGVSYLLAIGGLTMVRGWNRISIVLGFLAVIGLALALTMLAERVRFRRGARFERWLAAGVAALLLAVGMFDQTAPNDSRRRVWSLAAWEYDRDFFASMSQSLPPGSAVYQFPAMPFPEGGDIRGIGLYDEGRPYIHAPSLRWSYGAMLGRAPEWPADLMQRPPAEIGSFLVEQGFTAILVDRNGFEDRGVAFVDSLTVIDEPKSSADDRYVWFDLRTPPPG